MEHGKLSLGSWFYTMHLMVSVKQVVQHRSSASQYPLIGLMMKLHSIMGKREAICQLFSEVESDESFFPIRVTEESQGEVI